MTGLGSFLAWTGGRCACGFKRTKLFVYHSGHWWSTATRSFSRMSLLAPIGLRTEICKLLRMMPPALWNMIVTVLKSVKKLCLQQLQHRNVDQPPPLKTGIEIGIVKASTSANSRLHQLSAYSYNLAPAPAAGLPWHWIVNSYLEAQGT